MSVYNESRHLSQAIESILTQDFRDFEFLIFNDGSTDDSGKVIKQYADKDQRIRYSEQGNIGLTKTLNRALAQAEGEYIARMDADDVSLPGRLSREVEYLDKHPETAVVSVFADVIDDQGERIGEHRPGLSDKEVRSLILFSNQINHPAVMFRKSVVGQVGGYDERYTYAQDLDLWLRVMEKHQVCNLPEVLLLWRKSDKALGVKHYERQKYFARKARLAAIRRGQYPAYMAIAVYWLDLRRFVPEGVKNFFKKIVSK